MVGHCVCEPRSFLGSSQKTDCKVRYGELSIATHTRHLSTEFESLQAVIRAELPGRQAHAANLSSLASRAVRLRADKTRPVLNADF